MDGTEADLIKEFLSYLKKEGYSVQCQYDKYTTVDVSFDTLLKDYEEYKYTEKTNERI
jgi:hypothetical protein